MIKRNRVPYDDRDYKEMLWHIKMKEGKKLNPVEIEEWLRHEYREEWEKLKAEKTFRGIPNF